MKHFITSVLIKKIRHLEEIEIPLSNDKIKHLILTGKNGSGKTSAIEMMRDYLANVQSGGLSQLPNWIDALNIWRTQLIEIDAQPSTPQRIQQKDSLLQAITSHEHLIDNLKINNVELIFSSMVDLLQDYRAGKFILSYFPASRSTQMDSPQGPDKFEPRKVYDINVIPNNHNVIPNNQPVASSKFIQYLVNLKTQKSFAVSESSNQNSQETISKIDKWFEKFEGLLKQIYLDENLELQFDFKNYNFYIKTKDREKFTFNELSRGYSSIINIITELMLRMEMNKTDSYDVEGIVLIDEIETHLHIELQKNILPFLTNFFPNIQFIVTTHSPFVLSSIVDAVIYDLEKQIFVEDLTAYSCKAIIEDYFGSDQYSKFITHKLEAYKKLKAQQSSLTGEKRQELIELEKELDIIDDNASPEIVAEISRLNLKYGAVNV